MSTDFIALTDLSAALCAEQSINPRDNRFIRISSLYQCKRQIGYRITDSFNEDLPSPHLLHIFDVGHALHYTMQLRLSKHGTLGWVNANPKISIDPITHKANLGWIGNCEVPVVSDKYRIRGTLDCLTEPLVISDIVSSKDNTKFQSYRVSEKGKRYIIDIKTITARESVSDYGNKLYPSAFEKLEKPKPEHILQASMYAWLTTQPGFKTDFISESLDQIPDVMLIYIAKDISEKRYERVLNSEDLNDGIKRIPYKVFRFPVDMNVVEAALAKVGSIWQQVDNNELPGRDYLHKPSNPDYNCTGCGFRKECYKEEGYFSSDVNYSHDVRVRFKYKTAQKPLTI